MSTAALKILNQLGGFWRMACLFTMVPMALQDQIYDIIAQYRFRLKCKLTACYRPPEEYRNRFLNNLTKSMSVLMNNQGGKPWEA